MKKLLKLFTTIIFLTTFINTNSFSQNLFTYVDLSSAGFDTEELAIYDTLCADTLYDTVMIVDVNDVWGVQVNGFLDVNIMGESSMTAKLHYYDVPDLENPGSDYHIWGWFYGMMEDENEDEYQDYDGDIYLSKNGNSIWGSMRPFNSEQKYNLVSIGEGKHLLLKFNMATLNNTFFKCENDDAGTTTASQSEPCDKEIRILFLYTQNAKKYTKYPAKIVPSYLNLLNGAVHNSTYGNTQGLNFVSAGVRELTFSEFIESNNIQTDIGINPSSQSLPYIPIIQYYRNLYEADLVICLVNNKKGTYKEYAGMSNGIGVNVNAAYSLVNITAPMNYYDLAHEVGHLMGGRHQQSWITGSPVTSEYDDASGHAHGYKISKGWSFWKRSYTSIMHVNIDNNDHVYSSPGLVWRNKIYGVVNQNDVLRKIYEGACDVADFRDGPSPNLDATLNGSSVSYTGHTVNCNAIAHYGIPLYDFEWFISTNGGLSYTLLNTYTNTSTSGISFTMPNVPTVLVAVAVKDAVNARVTKIKAISNYNYPFTSAYDTNPPSSKPGKTTSIAVNTASNTGITITPNPTNTITQIVTNIDTKDFSGNFELNITDLTGRKIATRAVYTVTDKWSFDTSGLLSGIYFVNLHGNKTDVTEKLLITK